MPTSSLKVPTTVPDRSRLRECNTWKIHVQQHMQMTGTPITSIGTPTENALFSKVNAINDISGDFDWAKSKN